jgi:hypothetical protein
MTFVVDPPAIVALAPPRITLDSEFPPVKTTDDAVLRPSRALVALVVTAADPEMARFIVSMFEMLSKS